MGENRNAYRVWHRNLKETDDFEIPRQREKIIKLLLKGTGCEDVYWNHMAQDRGKVGLL
jgi:hypothetical protein